MKCASRFLALPLAAFLALALSGCTSLAINAPDGFFLSTGDYVPGVKTLGIVQADRTKLAVLGFYDVNKIRQDLMKNLLEKAKASGGDGLTNVTFSYKLSPWTAATVFIATITINCYMEGVVIRKED